MTEAFIQLIGQIVRTAIKRYYSCNILINN